MKEFLQTIFKSTEDRIKNPFIGAFLTSWTLFNWKSILYLIFSSETIKDKINYISSNYTDIWYYLLLPLFSAIFYIGILPYVNLGFEWLVKFSISRRNNVSLETRKANLDLQIEVAQNEIIIEEAKTTFRERNSHNMMVENLQNQISSLNSSLDEANNNISSITTKNTDEKNVLNQQINMLKNDLKTKDNELSISISDEKSKYRELLNEYTNDKNIIARYEFQIADLTDELKVERFKAERLRRPENKVLKVGNVLMLEYLTPLNEFIYYELNDDMLVDFKKVTDLLLTSPSQEIYHSKESMELLVRQMLNGLSSEYKILNKLK